MERIFAFSNEYWAKILRIFGIEVIQDQNRLLNLSNSILLVSEDKKILLKDLIDKLEDQNMVIGELPANSLSEFKIDDLERLISKILGFSTKK